MGGGYNKGYQFDSLKNPSPLMNRTTQPISEHQNLNNNVNIAGCAYHTLQNGIVYAPISTHNIARFQPYFQPFNSYPKKITPKPKQAENAR